MNPANAKGAIVEEISIRATADRIFEALTNPSQLVKWWGMEGRFQVTHMEADLRAGGKWTMSGAGLGGKPFRVIGSYRRVERPRLLEFTWLPDWQENPEESTVRIDLEENAGVTKVRLTHSGLTNEVSRASHRGWPQILSWLQAYTET